MPTIPPFPVLLAIAIIIFLAIGIHEYCHAKFADMAGDPTPGIYGRVTWNLTKHFELFGTIMIVITSLYGVGIGWGKPVPMDPNKMRNPRWDHFVAVLAGPVSNLVQATIFAVLTRVILMTSPGLLANEFLGSLMIFGIVINVGLFVFNLIPIGPLDGMWIVSTFLPDPARYNWVRFNLTYGQLVFLALIFIRPGGESLISMIAAPIRDLVLVRLLGVPL